MSQTTLLINDSQTIKGNQCLNSLPLSSQISNMTGVCPPKALGYLNLDGRGIPFSIVMKYHLDFFLFWGKFMTFLTLGSFAFPDILLLCILETFQSQTINIMRLLFSYEQAISS